MKDLVEYIVKQIVKNPDQVQVEQAIEDGLIKISIHVNPEDTGIVIGKAGQTIKALRKLLTIRAKAEGHNVDLQIVE